MKIAIYARVSTTQQETEQQVEACKRYAEMKGWEVATIIAEERSAWKGPRPKWEALKRDLRAMKYQGLIVFRIDRAWRRSSEFALDIDEFNRRGVSVVTVMEGIDASTPMGQALLNVIVALAQLERTNIAEATKQRLSALKSMGKKLGRPLGDSHMDTLGRKADELILTTYHELGSVRATARKLHVSTWKVSSVLSAARLESPPQKPESGT
jgi:DNA invertase Pin-like site-specific DNA recombinase